MSNDLLALSDYTMLDPEGDIDFFLSEASTQKFAAICVLPEHVQQARTITVGPSLVQPVGSPMGTALCMNELPR